MFSKNKHWIIIETTFINMFSKNKYWIIIKIWNNLHKYVFLD